MSLTRAEPADDKLTQTNALALLREGETSAHELSAWIVDGFPVLPDGRHRHAVFDVRVWALRRAGTKGRPVA